MEEKKRSLATRLAQSGTHDATTATRDLTPPIHLSTTYERDPDLSYPEGYVYGRHANPTRTLLEATLADLDNAEEAMCFSSGMAAVNATVQAFPRTYWLTPDDLYHGVRTLLATVFAGWGAKGEAVDMTDLEAVESALAKAFADGDTERVCVWMETPSNPLLKVTDICHVSRLAETMSERVGKPAITLVDATWCTPFLFRPLDLGADLVLHSCTKYMGGHTDLLGGVVACRRHKRSPNGQPLELARPIRHVQQAAGAVLSPFEAWLTLRGLRSLAPRMRTHCENAMRLAEYLDTHPAVEAVHYPGLERHPGNDVAKRMMGGKMFGGMLSIQVKGGREGAVHLQSNVRIFRRATSLGGTESLLEHRRSVEGPLSTTPENLVRISVGLEAIEDLRADLACALDSVMVQVLGCS